MFLVLALIQLLSATNYVDLVTFDGAKTSTYEWYLTNDPVMGGLSSSTWYLDTTDQQARWNGTCRVVPKLKAPGFCNAENKYAWFQYMNDASPYTHLQIMLRSRIDYTGFKISFAANTLIPQFYSFKADFTVTSDPTNPQWQVVMLPWNAFSNDWSAYTGEPIKRCNSTYPDVCPKADDLKKIKQIGFWTEGVAGDFDVDIKWVRAGFAHGKEVRSTPVKNNVCRGPVQANLRYNISSIKFNDETLTEAICCNNDAGIAEPQFLFQNVGLFDRISSTGITTFYDPVCGLPLFRAPIGRSFEDWKSETEEHGWPSFRDAELVKENVVIDGQIVSSRCGTRLGDNLPDSSGNRYCLDLVCLAGNPVRRH